MLAPVLALVLAAPLIAAPLHSPAAVDVQDAKQAPKPTPEVQKLIDAAISDKLEWKDKIPLLEKALARARELKDACGEGTALFWMGSVTRSLGNPRRALGYLEEALLFRSKVGDVAGAAATINSIGEVWSAVGENRKALAQYEKALGLFREAGDLRGEAAALNNLGGVWMDLDDKRLALEFYEQALQLRRKLADASAEAKTLNNIGVLLNDLKESRKALAFFEQALPLIRDVGDKRVEAVILGNIGGAWLALGERRKGLDYFELALTLSREVEDVRGEARCLNNIGSVLAELKEPGRALVYFSRALPMLREVGDVVGEAVTLRNLGLQWSELGNSGLGVAWRKLAVNALQTIRQGSAGVSVETDMSLLRSMKDWYDDLTFSLQSQGRITEVMQILAMQEMGGLREATRGKGPAADTLGLRLSLTRLEKKWLGVYEATAKPFGELGKEREELIRVRERSLAQEKRLQELDRTLESAQKEFQDALDAMAKAFQNPEPNANDIDDLRRDENLANLAADLSEATDKRTAIIATLVAKDQLFLLLALPSGISRMLAIPVARADLSKVVTEALQAVRSPDLLPSRALRKVYDWVISPIVDDLRGAEVQCLMFNLNGPLRYLPVSALYDGERYLAERFQCTNFSLIARQYLDNDMPKMPWKSVFFGVTKSFESFASLAGVEEETTAAAAMFGTRPLLNEKFNSSVLETVLKARDTRLVHFGTHFFLAPGSNDETFMLLGNGAKWRLSELEASNSLGFRGVELLVAAACETGVPTGDDSTIEGFGAYCQVKGAKSVLSTLWKVSDHGTSQWMTTFYRLLAGGAGKGEAYHRAQLAMITGEDAAALALPKGGARSGPTTPPPVSSSPGKPFIPDPKRPYAHPYYWAPFTLSGNWR